MPTLLEILVIALVLLLVFTAGRLGDLGDGLGRLIHGEPAPEPSGEHAAEIEAPVEQEDLD